MLFLHVHRIPSFLPYIFDLDQVIMNFRQFLLAVFCLFFLSPMGMAAEVRTVETDDAGIEVRIFPATGDRLLLGFPCDEGRSIAEEKTATSLSEDGIEVWMPDMLSAYMLPKVRSSIANIPSDALTALIREALKTGKQVYLIASGPDTELVLRAARHWEASEDEPLAGGVLLFPRLFKSEPEPGKQPEYVDAVGKTRLPLVLLEGERTPNRWGVQHLTTELGKGGSEVYAKIIPAVRGYFFKRQDANRPEK